ncbi:hypothetical protein BD560DRAFT_435176 [Blakeslea trispora]|nr:hypothetical protein BD560DRAFT_435176 [Blakeslea trispora]
MEEEDDDEDKEGNEEGKEAKGKGKEEDAGEDQEDTEEILSKMTRRCKKDKNEEGLALVAVTRMIAENDNWFDSITEESFIDQHLLPFVKVIFMNDRTFVYCRSAGRIPLSDSSRSLSKGKDSCLALKPDFCVMYDFQGENVGLLAIEPESFGVLVEGFECTFFSCSLHQSGCYVFGELQRLSLPKSDDDLMLIPDLVLAFMKMKRAMKDSIAQLRKKQKTEQLTSLEPMIKQTVELPQKLASSSCI